MPARTYTLPIALRRRAGHRHRARRGRPGPAAARRRRPRFLRRLRRPAAPRGSRPACSPRSTPGSAAPRARRGSIPSRRLAEVYARLLDELDLTGVTVVGNSIGGWIAAELALARAATACPRLIVFDAAGLVSAEHPVGGLLLADARPGRPSYSCQPGRVPDRPVGADRRAAALFGGNRAALAVYGGPSMADPGLAGGWPASPPDPGGLGRGRPDGHRRLRPRVRRGDPRRGVPRCCRAGHLPQLETPEAVLALFAQA